MSFLCGVGLTFEAANLDHSLHYRNVFRQAGDQETAEVLQRVHDEEVQHVRLANVWLRRLANRSESDLELYQRYAVPPTFGLHKARGKGFAGAASRRCAGLSEAFVHAAKEASRAVSGQEPIIMGCGASAESTQKKKQPTTPEEQSNDRIKDKKAAKDENKAYQMQLQFLEHVPLMKRLPKDQHPLVASVCEMHDYKKGD
eukprot:g16184.t1